MTTDLIDIDYVYNHRLFKIWKGLLVIYGILLIFLTKDNGFETLIKYEYIITVVSQIFFISWIVIFILKTLMFSRVGKLSIDQDRFVIDLKDTRQIVDLNMVNEITLGKHSRKFYHLEVLDHDLVLELDKSQLNALKHILTQQDIKIKHRLLTDRISTWFRK